MKARINKSDLRRFITRVEGVKSAFSSSDAKDTAKEVVAEMKDMILKGISPVKSVGRFPAYLRAGEKGKYPDNQRRKYPAKRQRPVNLKLSGDFLKALRYRVFSGKNGSYFEIGYYDEDSIKKEEGHALGWNGQPQRPTIPDDGEFAERIQRIIFNGFKRAVSAFVKKK